MNCWLCNLFRKTQASRRAAHSFTNDKSNAWEWANSNANELWALEPDTDRLKQAEDLDTSDPKAAFEMFLALAEQGSIVAMQCVAWHYGFGQGKVVAPDVRLAEDWYIKAIGAGSWMATRYYAQLLAKHGRFSACKAVLQDGVTQDWTPAFFWFAWACRKQSRSRKTYREIEPLLEYAAQKGHPYAQMQFALFMLRGKFGFWKIPRGIKLYWEHMAIRNAEMEATPNTNLRCL